MATSAALHRAHTVELVRLLRTVGGAKRAHRPAPLPRQQQPDAIRFGYWKAITPVCDRAAAEVHREAPEILRLLADTRRAMGKTDARDVGVDASYRDVRRAIARAGAPMREYGRCAIGPLLVLEEPPPAPGRPTIVVVTGQHGEEIAGPLLWARHGAQLVDAARARGLGLVVYPCVNPEGFDARRRRDYNGDTNANAFLEYSVGGRWVGELAPGDDYNGERRPVAQAPETAALYDDVVERFAGDHPPDVVLDLHQDAICHRREVFAYGYARRRADLARVIAAAGDPLLGRQLQNGSWSRVPLRTGADGVAVLRDGSITDFADRAGAWSIATEASADDVEDAIAVDRRLLLALFDVVAAGAVARRADASGIGIGLGVADANGRKARKLVDDAAGRFADGFRPHELHAVALKFGERTDDFARAQLDRQVRAAMGVPFNAIEKPTRDRLEGFAAGNVDLIRTMSDRYFDRIRLDVEDAYTTGVRPEHLAADFVDRLDMSHRDAMRIARDQIGKLNAQVNQDRQQALGLDAYVWRCMRDNRVRDNHLALDGQRFTWAEPPAGGGTDEDEPGSPGEGIQCRCYAEPDFSPLTSDQPIEREPVLEPEEAGVVEEPEPPPPEPEPVAPPPPEPAPPPFEPQPITPVDTTFRTLTVHEQIAEGRDLHTLRDALAADKLDQVRRPVQEVISRRYGLAQRAGSAQHELTTRPGSEMGTAVGLHYLETGRVEITPEVQRQAVHAITAHRAGAVPSATSLDGLRVVLHEEIHGHSPIAPAAYDGIGKVVEEVTTELAARRAVGDLVGQEGPGAYQDWINEVVGSVRDAAAVPHDQAFRAVERAAFEMRKTRSAITDPDRYATHFVNNLPLGVDQRRAILSKLRADYTGRKIDDVEHVDRPGRPIETWQVPRNNIDAALRCARSRVAAGVWKPEDGASLLQGMDDPAALAAALKPIVVDAAR